MNTPKNRNAKDDRKRIELCDWNETLHATALNKRDHYTVKAKSRGRLTENEIAARAGINAEDIERLLTAVGNAVHEGYDVQLCDAVRFYACALKLKTPVIVAQTTGNFRRSISDKSIRPVLHGKEVSLDHIKKLDRKARLEYPHVTPDMMMTCPACSHMFRVGKKLG